MNTNRTQLSALRLRKYSRGMVDLLRGSLGVPLSHVFRAIILVRRFAYDRGWLRTTRPSLFTISVGGLEAGGSGKTPVTSLILHALIANGRFPGLLSRGYGRASRGVVIRPRHSAVDPRMVGDEPAMLISEGLDIPAAICARRVRGIKPLMGMGCDTLVLDDAFSHRALQRHVDIVVLRGEQPLGNGALLPHGSLREPPSSLRRADVIWLHYRRDTIPHEPPLWLSQWCPGATWVMSRAVPALPQDSAGTIIALRDKRVVVAAGIAHPEDVVRTLHDAGAHVAQHIPFADHHAYTPDDVAILTASARDHQADGIVITPKDAVKLKSLWRGDIPLWILGTRVQIVSGAQALARHLHLLPETLISPDRDPAGEK